MGVIVAPGTVPVRDVRNLFAVVHLFVNLTCSR
jgi:hypothetical protein